MFTRFCSQVVSKVRHTVVDVWQQHPQSHGAFALFMFVPVLRVGVNSADNVGRVIVCATGALAAFTVGFPLRVFLAADMLAGTSAARIKRSPGIPFRFYRQAFKLPFMVFR